MMVNLLIGMSEHPKRAVWEFNKIIRIEEHPPRTDKSAPTIVLFILLKAIIGGVRDHVVSIDNTDYEIDPSTVTRSRSEGSIALVTEMLRCTQHDNAATHTDIPVHLLIYIMRSSQTRPHAFSLR